MKRFLPATKRTFLSLLRRVLRIDPISETKDGSDPHRVTSTFFPPAKQPLPNEPKHEKPDTTTTMPVRVSSTETDQHLLNLVDLLDEIALLKQGPGGVCQSLDIVESRLFDLIAMSDGEIIRDLGWQPERQRAVEVVPGQSRIPTFLSSRRSGLAVHDRIVRKQDVVISKSQTKN